MLFLKLTLILYGLLMVFDLIWQVILAKKFYFSQIGSLMKQVPNVLAGVIVYFLITIGLLIFVVSPYIANPHASNPVFMGALYGFIIYSVYDLTNLAVIYRWPLELTIVDIVWGTFLTSFSTYLLVNFFL